MNFKTFKWSERPCVSARVDRNATRFLFLFQSFYAGIVLGIVGWFLSHCNDELLVYPKARLIFTEVFAALGFIYACVFVLIFNATTRWMLYSNILWALIWFAAYGVMVEFDCSDNFEGWEEKFGPNFQACWSAATAFCFLGGFFYLVLVVFNIFTNCWVGKAPQHQMHEKRISGESEAPVNV